MNFSPFDSHPDHALSIISTVLNWDIKELESRATKIERDRAKVGQEQLNALKAYAGQAREDHEAIRVHSGRSDIILAFLCSSLLEKNSISIVTAILESSGKSADLTEDSHKAALDYVSIQLSIRDRKQIIQVLCHSQPDYLTQSLWELVDAYTPVIRQVHNAVNLSDTVGDFEQFLRDLIKLSKLHTDKSGKSVVPTVGDFVQLLRKHQSAGHKFIHQCCKNGKEVTSWYIDWVKNAAAQFRCSSSSAEHSGMGDLSLPLGAQFSSLPSDTREIILPILDQQAAYLDQINASSLSRVSDVLHTPPSSNPQISRIFSTHGLPGLSNSRPGSRTASPDRASTKSEPDEDSGKTPTVASDPGPGVYLARWQHLLDSTLITPATAHGPVRRAGNQDVVNQSATDVDGEQMVEIEKKRAGKDLEKVLEGREKDAKSRGRVERPDVAPVIDSMLKGFRHILAEKSCNW